MSGCSFSLLRLSGSSKVSIEFAAPSDELEQEPTESKSSSNILKLGRWDIQNPARLGQCDRQCIHLPMGLRREGELLHDVEACSTLPDIL